MRASATGLILAATTAVAASADMVGGPDFAAKLESYNGRTITVSRCDIFKKIDDQGMMACTVKNGAGDDAPDARGLPVYVFFKVDALSPETKALIDSCEMFCPGAITGKASVSPGTLYVEFTDVTFAKMMP